MSGALPVGRLPERLSRNEWTSGIIFVDGERIDDWASAPVLPIGDFILDRIAPSL